MVAPERQPIVLFCGLDKGEMLECLKNFGSPMYPLGKVKKMYGTNDLNMNLEILLKFNHFSFLNPFSTEKLLVLISLVR